MNYHEIPLRDCPDPGIKEAAEDSYCLKRRVVAVIYDTRDDMEFVSIGWSGPPYAVSECPRLDMASGEHYELCDENCHGQRHAEVSAIGEACEDVKGLAMYVYGHDHICTSCYNECERLGISDLYLVR